MAVPCQFAYRLHLLRPVNGLSGLLGSLGLATQAVKCNQTFGTRNEMLV